MEHAALEFMAAKLEEGKPQEEINTVISAVSQAVEIVTGRSISQDGMMRMAKRHLSRAVPRAIKYMEIYDIDPIFTTFDAMGSNSALSLEDLRSKVVVLLKLDTMCRNGDIAKTYVHPLLFNLEDHQLKVRFFDPKERSGPTDWIIVDAYPSHPNICTVAAVSEYMRQTADISPTTVQLKWRQHSINAPPLILHIKKHQAVSSQYVSNLTTKILRRSDIMHPYTGYSTRAASVSKAMAMGATKDRVMQHARLTERMMRRHYLRLTTGQRVPATDPNAPLSHLLRHSYSLSISSNNTN
jgi:hypothetical protein